MSTIKLPTATGHLADDRLGRQSARSRLHLAELFRLADRAGLLADPERTAARLREILAVHRAVA